MGIVGLWDFVKKTGVGCTLIKWQDFKGKKIAIEANTLAFKYKYGNQPDSLFQQFALLIADCWEVGVESIIVVMDGGNYPEIKLSTKLKRQKESQKCRETTLKVEQLLFSSTLPNESLDDETIKMISPQFFQNLKRKADSCHIPVPLYKEEDQPVETTICSTDQPALVLETNIPVTNQVITKQESTAQWIEEEKKKWTKEDFLKTVYEAKQKISPVTSNDYEQLGFMLAQMGVITVNADGESESFCASLSQMGIVDWVISEDSDLFGFGAKKIVRDMSWASKRKESFRLYDVDIISQHLGIDPKDWISMCVLCQNDYNKDGCRVAGIGMANAYKEIKSGKTWDLVMTNKFQSKSTKKQKPTSCDATLNEDKPEFTMEEILEKGQKIYDYFHSFWVNPADFCNEQKNAVEEWLLSFKRTPNFESFCQFWDEKQKSPLFISSIATSWKLVHSLDQFEKDIYFVSDQQHVE